MALSSIYSSPRPLGAIDAQHSVPCDARRSSPPPFRRSVHRETRPEPALHLDAGRLSARAAEWDLLNLCRENALRAWALHPAGYMAAYTEIFDRPTNGRIMSRMNGMMKGETGIFYNPSAVRPHARLMGDPSSFEFVLNDNVVGPNSSEADIRLAQQIATIFCMMA